MNKSQQRSNLTRFSLFHVRFSSSYSNTFLDGVLLPPLLFSLPFFFSHTQIQPFISLSITYYFSLSSLSLSLCLSLSHAYFTCFFPPSSISHTRCLSPSLFILGHSSKDCLPSLFLVLPLFFSFVNPKTPPTSEFSDQLSFIKQHSEHLECFSFY